MPVTTIALEPVAAAYIAGLIDGEGTITLSRMHTNERRRLVISIANTELPLLQYVLQTVGAGKITRKRASSPRHTPSYCYTISSQQALALLECIAPHLQTYKRQRACLALARYRSLTPRNGKYTQEQTRRRQQFEHEFLATLPNRNGDPPA